MANFLHVVLLLLSLRAAAGRFIAYNTSAGAVAGKLNVHLVPHSHDDVGWLKTVDQYFVGSNNSLHGACVMNVLDSLVDALQKDPNRKFVFVEQAFFQRWWAEKSEYTKKIVKKLVASGQLEFINGGWCMHDEATVHYIDMIDQTTLGHWALKKQFGVVPRAGWQIDPFGHSSVQAYLLGAEIGFDSVHFARIDYQDRFKRKSAKSLEVIWRGSKTFGSSSQIFANAFPVHYSPPDGFNFDITEENNIPVQDDPMLYDYNVDQRVNDFIDAAIAQANVTRTNHIMWTMGDDFQYQYAESWFRQMDKLIHYVNKDGRVHALYSTPSLYTDAKHEANEHWPVKYDDYFPYADAKDAYWTGYFTSRPAFKRYVRFLSGYYLTSRQLEFMAGETSLGFFTWSLGEALGIAQHHDAVTGTAKQHTTNDYTKRLSAGCAKAEAGVNLALTCLTSLNKSCAASAVEFAQCKLLNISYCPSTNRISAGSLVVVAYNSLGWNRTDYVKIPVADNQLVVRSSDGTYIDTQFVEIDNITSNLRDLYVKAYLNVSVDEPPKYWLTFQVSLPAIGWNTYFISKQKGEERKHTVEASSLAVQDNDTITVGRGSLKMSFSSASGQATRIMNSISGTDVPLLQNYLWYVSSPGDADWQPSGAYIFRPQGSSAVPSTKMVTMEVIRGPLFDEVRQQFSSWIYQITRLYKDKEHAEVEYTIGPIPTDDNNGKEIITRLTTNMATKSTFYTDSNGRDFLKRVRNHRDDWNLNVTQPIAGNYYPVNLGVYVKDERYELSVLVDHAVGASSIRDGEIELMLHRRILHDDGRGVAENLDEKVCVGSSCEGLVVKGTYYININKVGDGPQWRRTCGQQIYSPILLAFTHGDEKAWKSTHVADASLMDKGYNLPKNVAIITLQVLDDWSTLLRLAHLYEAGEDAKHSAIAEVELRKLFAGKKIENIIETSLSANQEKAKMKRLQWMVEGDADSAPEPVRGGPVDPEALVVELGPMEIRTFLLNF